MSNLTAQHYLEIYLRRQRMISDGVTHPEQRVIDFVNRLVNELETLAPEERIELLASDTDTVFRIASTGKILAEMHN